MVAVKKIGKQTVKFSKPPVILATASVVGPKEGEGPLAESFDQIVDNPYFGEKSWEKAEHKMLSEAAYMVLNKMALTTDEIDYFLCGDLSNQIISANFTARDLGIPFLGLYGACSTAYEGLAIGAMLIDGGYAARVLTSASSHYSTAERQYRFPSEQGVQRPLSSQWTVTGAGAFLLAEEGQGPKITYCTVGKTLDLGIKDANDMGSAMAPAAVDTILKHFEDTGFGPESYDLIVTGDLGQVGKKMALKLAEQKGYNLEGKYADCGVMIFDPAQDTHAGGSGCACSAVVTAGYLINEMKSGRIKRLLGVGTGALLSPVSVQQGESIPGIGHAVTIEI